MPGNHKKRFSYSGLPDAKAEELRGIAATLEPLLKGLHPTALEAGSELRRAKDILKHGGFGPFCRDVMKIDVRMCQHYINIADLADKIGLELVEQMPASSAAALSSAPSAIVSQIVNEIQDGGKCPSVRKIKERIREARGNRASVATVEHDDERVANVASMLMTKLEKHELADLMDLLTAANSTSIVALCDKIHSLMASG
jgi:hypothetical protein